MREGGYRIPVESDPGYAEATPIDVEIRKFWMWVSPGFWAMHLEFRAAIALKGPFAPASRAST